MKRVDPRDTVYTSDAEELRRRYNLERILAGEEALSSSPVYSSGHGIDIDENNIIQIVTAGLSENETLPPMAGDVYEKFVQVNEAAGQMNEYISGTADTLSGFIEKTGDDFVALSGSIDDLAVSLNEYKTQTDAELSDMESDIETVDSELIRFRQKAESDITDMGDAVSSLDAAFVQFRQQTNNSVSNMREDINDISGTVAEHEELLSVIDANVAPFGVQKILWSGGNSMHSGQTVTLSEKVSEQPHGIVLMFSYYNNSNQNESFSSHFVPKQAVVLHDGCGHNFNLCGMWANAVKYLYISDTQITGHANNTGTRTIGNISHNNSYYVLRYVIGV